MVAYGPATIHGRSYILPRYSVSIMRSRSTALLQQWNVGFATWGPYATQMSVFTFNRYYMFFVHARILPGFQQLP